MFFMTGTLIFVKNFECIFEFCEYVFVVFGVISFNLIGDMSPMILIGVKCIGLIFCCQR